MPGVHPGPEFFSGSNVNIFSLLFSHLALNVIVQAVKFLSQKPRYVEKNTMPKKTKIWMFFATAIAWLLLVGASRSFLTSLSKLAIRWLGNLYISITSLSGIPNKLTRVEKCLFKHTHLNLCYASPVFFKGGKCRCN